MISAEDLIKLLNSKPSASPFKLGAINSNHVSGRPKILFDGEIVVSQKQYPYLSSYSPVAGDRVLLVSIGGSFIVLGKII